MYCKCTCLISYEARLAHFTDGDKNQYDTEKNILLMGDLSEFAKKFLYVIRARRTRIGKQSKLLDDDEAF